ncbi:MAG: hypothetical protein RJB23_402 [Pseudomonadota bacterium]|jgi:hypothetical protein
METINQKVDHLNKLTMIAMTSKDAYMFRANQEVCEFINSLKGEGYNICEGDELDIYTDYEMHVIDRLTALISQSMSADEVIRYGMADDGEELELDQFYSYMSDSEIGLLECCVKNPEGIRFFYLDGDDITLKKAPYFLFQDCITDKVGLYASEEILKTEEYLEIAANAVWEKNPLDD